MNYNAHYNTLIERAKTRLLEGYSEQHHVVPRCLGGSDDADNLVGLTPEEHYVAHQLLVKMNPGNIDLIRAARMMTIGSKTLDRVHNKMYGWLKRQFSAAQSKAMTGTKRGPMSEETKRKIGKANATPQKQVVCPHCNKEGGITIMGRWHFDNCGKPNTSTPWNKGKKMPAEFGEKISQIQLGKKRGPMSEETKRKIGLANSGPTGRTQSKESNAKRAATMRAWCNNNRSTT